MLISKAHVVAGGWFVVVACVISQCRSLLAQTADQPEPSQTQTDIANLLEMSIMGSHGKIGIYCEYVQDLTDDRVLLLGLMDPKVLPFTDNVLKDGGLRVKDVFYSTLVQKYRHEVAQHGIEDLGYDDSIAARDEAAQRMLQFLIVNKTTWTAEELTFLHIAIANSVGRLSLSSKYVGPLARSSFPEDADATSLEHRWLVTTNSSQTLLAVRLKPKVANGSKSIQFKTDAGLGFFVVYEPDNAVLSEYAGSQNIEQWITTSIGGEIKSELAKAKASKPLVNHDPR